MSSTARHGQLTKILLLSAKGKMLNKALRLLRVLHDLKQKDMALKLAISTSHLSEIESGKKTPTLAVLNRYAEVFDIPVSSILFFSENIEAAMEGQQINTDFPSSLLAMMELAKLSKQNIT